MRLLHFPLQFHFWPAKLIRSHPHPLPMVVTDDPALLGGTKKTAKPRAGCLHRFPQVHCLRAAFAQAPAPTTKPAAAQPAPATDKAADTDKKAISKACSDQATAKGLHGKARKTFRSECKKNGGKPA